MNVAPWQQRLETEVFGLGAHVRYVAFGDGQRISMSQRPELDSASAQESDFYEELLVNPAVLELTRRRGELDCGGLEFVVIGYGNFNQVVLPAPSGHVSVGVEKSADPMEVGATVAGLIEAIDGS